MCNMGWRGLLFHTTLFFSNRNNMIFFFHADFTQVLQPCLSSMWCFAFQALQCAPPSHFSRWTPAGGICLYRLGPQSGGDFFQHRILFEPKDKAEDFSHCPKINIAFPKEADIEIIWPWNYLLVVLYTVQYRFLIGRDAFISTVLFWGKPCPPPPPLPPYHVIHPDDCKANRFPVASGHKVVAYHVFRQASKSNQSRLPWPPTESLSAVGH